MKRLNQTSKIKEITIKYIKRNSKEFILTSLIFIIGLFIGVMFINNCSEDKSNLILEYINKFSDEFKQIEQIDKRTLFVNSIKSNIILTIALWFAGTTIIGMPVVLGIILYRGFCLGTTISAISMAWGIKKGLLFCFTTLFLKNVFFIPAIVTMGVSSIKMYKSVISDRRKENIKIQIISHTIISLIMLIILVFSSFLENTISIDLLNVFIIN